MNTAYQTVDSDLIPREKLDFDLDSEIPKYWCDGDPFKTRFFDALSAQFPEGERFFMTCVRDFREQITDERLTADIAGFMRQEGQHGKIHGRYNQLLAAQGIRIDKIEQTQQRILRRVRSWFSPRFTIALTAASEHMTAIMAHSFFDRQDIFAGADERMRALYAWHAMEEVEHKAVAYEVMTQVAHSGYFRRILAMLVNTLSFPIDTFLIMGHMFRVDGYSRSERLGLWLRGLWWLYKPSGVFMPVLRHYFQYYRIGFHPRQEGSTRQYEVWSRTYRESHDPIVAGNAVYATAKARAATA